MPTPLCTRCTRWSLSPCPNLNSIHYKKWLDYNIAGCLKNKKLLQYTPFYYLNI
ncbi:cation-transporting ATPase [Kingella kingae]|nr:cation-transporting ATPase [Kingella kingae]